MHTRGPLRTIVAAAGAMLVLNGCTPKRMPLVLDPQLNAVQVITLLPVVDARRDTSSRLDLESSARKTVREELEKKGYQVDSPAAFSDGDAVTMEEVAEMEPAELTRLGPASARALMVVSLNDVYTSYVVMAYTYKAEVSGIMIDKTSGAVLWKDKGMVSGGQGGLVSGIIAAAASEESFASGASKALLETLPERPRSH